MPEVIHAHTATSIDILDQNEYFDAFNRDVRKAEAGERVSYTTMSMEPTEDRTQSLLAELDDAARRDVQVNFAVDAYTFMTDSTTGSFGPMFSKAIGKSEVFANRAAAIQNLAAHESVTAGIVNVPGRQLSNPFAGRNHIKAAAVGGVTYIGGPNLHDTERSDMVLRIENDNLSHWTHDMIGRLALYGSTAEALGEHDLVVPIDSQTDLLVDIGARKRSLIMKAALGVIDRAEERVILSSQFFPSGAVTSRLKQRHKEDGIDVRIFRNYSGNEQGPKRLWQSGSLALNRMRLPGSFFSDELPAGSAPSHIAVLSSESEVLKGGHNFNNLGVRFGTAEAVLHRRNDREFAQQIASFVFRTASTQTEQASHLAPHPFPTPEIAQ